MSNITVRVMGVLKLRSLKKTVVIRSIIIVVTFYFRFFAISGNRCFSLPESISTRGARCCSVFSRLGNSPQLADLIARRTAGDETKYRNRVFKVLADW